MGASVGHIKVGWSFMPVEEVRSGCKREGIWQRTLLMERR